MAQIQTETTAWIVTPKQVSVGPAGASSHPRRHLQSVTKLQGTTGAYLFYTPQIDAAFAELAADKAVPETELATA